MIEMLSYLYEDCSLSDDQMICSYLYEYYSSLDDVLLQISLKNVRYFWIDLMIFSDLIIKRASFRYK
jgi:hypothetical protein